MIGYKRMRTKGIICHGSRPSDIDNNASAQDDESEGKEVTEEGESKPKRRKTCRNEVFIHHESKFSDSIFFKAVWILCVLFRRCEMNVLIFSNSRYGFWLLNRA